MKTKTLKTMIVQEHEAEDGVVRVFPASLQVVRTRFSRKVLDHAIELPWQDRQKTVLVVRGEGMTYALLDFATFEDAEGFWE